MNRRLLSVACCSAFLVCSHGASVAQQAPGALADAQNPTGAPGPMQSVSIWTVDSLSGALSLKIPLTKPLAGGRGPHYGTTLLYNSSSTLTLQFQTINSSNNYAMYAWVGANQSSSSFAPSGPWVFSGPIIQTNNQTIDDIPIYKSINGVQTLVGGFIGCTITGPALYEDPDGATHDLNVAYVTMNTNGYNNGDWSNNPSCSYTNTTISQSYDGSAIQSSLYNNSIPVAIGPDGTALSVTLEDSNGNVNNGYVINGNVNGGQDSEGRSQLSGSGSCTYVGSTKIAPATCTFTAYDANGAALDYKVTAETVTLGSFSMPNPTSSEMTNPFMGGVPGSTVSGIELEGLLGTNTITGVTSIEYPDTTSYQFGYSAVSECPQNPIYGTVTSITFPTGGHVDFCWIIRKSGEYSSVVSSQSTFAVSDVYLYSGSGSASHWTYSYNNITTGQSPVTTETAPDGTVTVYTGGFSAVYSTIFNRGAMPTFQETNRDITSGAGAHLRTIATTYVGNGDGWGQPSQVTTTYWDASPAQMQAVQYFYDAWGNVTEKDESDLYPSGSAPWLRKTFTTYAYVQPYCPESGPTHSCPTGTASNFQSPTSPYIHIVNKPSQVEVTDGSGNVYSIVQYGYDESPVCSSSQSCITSGVLNHDETSNGYPTSRQSGRGNLTSEARCAAPVPISGGSCPSASWLVTTYTYDLAGQRISSKDPKGNVTTYAYRDSFSAGAPGSEGTSFTYGNVNSPTDSFLTTATFANQATDTYKYDYYSGERASHVGWNSGPQGTPPTVYSFDFMQRPTSVSYPDGGGSTYCYTDEGGSTCNASSPPFTAYSSTTATPSPTLNSNVQYDELGRPLMSTSANGAETDTTYDSMGRVAFTDDPYFSGSSTGGYVTYAYDGLGRVITKCNQDNGTGSGACVAGSSYEQWAYSGATVTFTDEDKNSWQRTSDGLGRLTLVAEPNGAKTYYAYDPLGNLTCAAQDGGSGGTFTTCAAAPASWRPRTFSYDSASRLLTAYNPESGTVSYGYDGNGNLATKTDARGVTTSFTYDSLNRLLSKTYTNAPAGSLSSCYQYDTATNGIGHLGAEWTQAGACPSSPPASTVYQSLRTIGAYDVMGRMVSEQQCVAGYCTSAAVPSAPTANCTSLSTNNGLQYCYDEAGNLLAFSSGATTASVGAYPQAAMTFSQTFDSGGHLATLVSSWNDSTHPPTLFNGQSYTPWNALSNWLLGPHISLSRTYDSRLRVTGQTGTQQ